MLKNSEYSTTKQHLNYAILFIHLSTALINNNSFI